MTEEEIAQIVAMLTSPARFSVDLFMLIGVRPLEDGRFAVWWLAEPSDAMSEAIEYVYDEPYKAARHFLILRHEKKLGADYEGAEETRP